MGDYDLHINITGNDSNLASALNRSRENIRRTAREVQDSGLSIEKFFDRMGVIMAEYRFGHMEHHRNVVRMLEPDDAEHILTLCHRLPFLRRNRPRSFRFPAGTFRGIARKNGLTDSFP